MRPSPSAPARDRSHSVPAREALEDPFRTRGTHRKAGRGAPAKANVSMTTQIDRTRRSFAMEEAVAVLARTPATLDALLRGLPEGWTAAHEGGETWSPFDVIGHLIHGDRTDWVPRARI